jgi:hypothetical protein
MAEVVTLSRKEKIWKCSDCGREVLTIPTQCECGSLSDAFDEKQDIVEGPRKVYVVQKNIIYNGQHIDAGSIVSLISGDRVTKSLVARRLVSLQKEEKEVPIKEMEKK